MAAHRYWRLAAFTLDALADLELSELRLYAGGALADVGATLTTTIAPAAGSLADLTDNSTASIVSWPRSSWAQPGFAFKWDLGAGNEKDVDQLRAGGGSSASTYPQDLVLYYSDDGAAWTVARRARNLTFPGANTLSALTEDLATSTAVLPTTWQSSGNPANVLLSGNDLTAASYASHNARSAQGVTAGKWFWELRVDEAGSQNAAAIGLCTSTHPLTTFLGYDNLSWNYYGNDGKKYFGGTTGAAYAATYTTGDMIGMALDLDAGTLRFYKNGVDLGIAFSGIPSGPTYHAAMTGGSGSLPRAQVTANFGDSGFFGTPPAGFRKGLGIAATGGLLPGNDTATLRRLVAQPVPLLSSPSAEALDVPAAALVQTVRAHGDMYFGGMGRVYGTVKEKNTPANTPLRRRVILIDERSQLAIRETWSNAATGAFEFPYVATDRAYTVITLDHPHNYRAVIADNQMAEAMP